MCRFSGYFYFEWKKGGVKEGQVRWYHLRPKMWGVVIRLLLHIYAPRQNSSNRGSHYWYQTNTRLWAQVMAIWLVKFLKEGYKIRNTRTNRTPLETHFHIFLEAWISDSKYEFLFLPILEFRYAWISYIYEIWISLTLNLNSFLMFEFPTSYLNLFLKEVKRNMYKKYAKNSFLYFQFLFISFIFNRNYVTDLLAPLCFC